MGAYMAIYINKIKFQFLFFLYYKYTVYADQTEYIIC